MKHANIFKSMAILALVLALALLLLGCGQTAVVDPADGTESAPAETGASPKEYTVGISQFVTHEALDAATNGFMDALKAELGEDVKVNFDVQNAAADSATCSTIANAFVAKNVDLIMANATPALQAAFNATTTIPILGTSVTEYGVALGISDFTGVVGGNVSGTSDCAPLAEQAAMILELFPDAKNVGMLYCSAEPNSEYQVKVIEEELGAKGVNVVRYSFADSNDVASVTTKAAADSDVIYIPTDNTAASCAATIGNIVKGAKVPVVAGESGICANCGVATLSISYYDLGTATGKMAAKILTGEADISTMPIEYAPAKKMYNPAICEELGVTVPADYEAMN
ncbi:MAG: ABC transporter substrate-binding protein [Clostridia bacterium]|nr:ABC transporter substrate-binding protein [Clostridia bacterium]